MGKQEDPEHGLDARDGAQALPPSPLSICQVPAQQILGDQDFNTLMEERERLSENAPHALDHTPPCVLDRKSKTIREISRRHGGDWLGKRLRNFRRMAKLNQMDVYRLTGISNQLMEDIEAGKREVSTVEAGLLAKAYGVPVPVLLGMETGEEHALLTAFRKMTPERRKAMLVLFVEEST